MCGIVGYLGNGNAYDVLIKGLHRLEYRGYDSAGIALVAPGGKLNVFKAIVVDLYVFYKLHKNLGIGFRMKLAAMFLESILEEFVIFYRTVVYEREISILTVMRVCIAIRRLAMRCPSGMCYSH